MQFEHFLSPFGVSWYFIALRMGSFLAAMAAIEYLRGEKLLLEYTTTSKRLHERLGVSHPD